MARDDKHRRASRGGLSISSLREGLWVTIIVILWYLAHSAHWQLAQETERFEAQLSELQTTVTQTQTHARQLVARHCNATALADKLFGKTAAASASPQQYTASRGGCLPGHLTAKHSDEFAQRIAAAEAQAEVGAAKLAVCLSDLLDATRSSEGAIGSPHSESLGAFSRGVNANVSNGSGGGGLAGSVLGSMEEQALGGLHRMEEGAFRVEERVLAYFHQSNEQRQQQQPRSQVNSVDTKAVFAPPPPPPPPLPSASPPLSSAHALPAPVTEESTLNLPVVVIGAGGHDGGHGGADQAPVRERKSAEMGAALASAEWQRRDRTKELELGKGFGSASEGKGRGREWLLVGIPTVSRVNHEDHLLKVLSSILDQLPVERSDPFFGRVKVLVMNAQPPGQPHPVYEQAKALWGDPKTSPHAGNHVQFFDDLSPHSPDTGGKGAGNANRPGEKVRRQTRNIASVLREASYRGKYFLFLEDDMLLCPQAVRAAVYLLDRATEYHSRWFAVRASFGMNGVFMHSSDLDTFASFLVEHQSRRPPDHLVVEYFAGEKPQTAKIKAGRPHFGFRYNLCDHLGKHSTLRGAQAKQMPVCFEELVFPAVFQVESFKPNECPLDDLWPCPGGANTAPRLQGLPKAVLPPNHPSLKAGGGSGKQRGKRH